MTKTYLLCTTLPQNVVTNNTWSKGLLITVNVSEFGISLHLNSEIVYTMLLILNHFLFRSLRLHDSRWSVVQRTSMLVCAKQWPL